MTPQNLNDIAVILQKHQFRIDSDYGDNTAFGLTTDYQQGFKFRVDGSCHLLAKWSSEVVGNNLPTNPNACNIAKSIRAENGDIVLNAINGDITLIGKNIRIIATDALGGQIVLDSTKIIQLTSPITNVQGDNIAMAASGELAMAGGTASMSSQISTELTQGTDEVKASFFGKILSGIRKFTKFFSSLCEVK